MRSTYNPEPAPAPRRPKPLLVSRKVLVRSATAILAVLGALLVWALVATQRSLAAERTAAAAAHASSVRLVRLSMELQSELDAQEDHDRWTLQLYLRLERELLPKLHRGVSGAVKGCTEASRAAAEAALSELGEDAHRHSQAMLQALQRQGSRARKRAQEVASSILAQSRSDRERQLASGGSWSDSDLEGPLIALARQLRRPNATFELPLETLRECKDGGSHRGSVHAHAHRGSVHAHAHRGSVHAHRGKHRGSVHGHRGKHRGSACAWTFSTMHTHPPMRMRMHPLSRAHAPSLPCACTLSPMRMHPLSHAHAPSLPCTCTLSPVRMHPLSRAHALERCIVAALCACVEVRVRYVYDVLVHVYDVHVHLYAVQVGGCECDSDARGGCRRQRQRDCHAPHPPRVHGGTPPG